MKRLSLRLLGLVAALLLAALPDGAAARGGMPIADNFVPENSFHHYGGYGCLYTCGYDGNRGDGGCYDRCYRPIRCHCYWRGRDNWPPFAPAVRSEYEDAMRDYWHHSQDFQQANDRFKKDDDTWRGQAQWYQDCMNDRRRCVPPGPPGPVP